MKRKKKKYFFNWPLNSQILYSVAYLNAGCRVAILEWSIIYNVKDEIELLWRKNEEWKTGQLTACYTPSSYLCFKIN